MIQKIYKNTDLLFTINLTDNDNNIININDVSELSIVFFTDSTSSDNFIEITKDDIINDNQIFLDNSKLDLLNEGLLKYNIKLRFNHTSIDEPFDIAKTIETEYFIKNDNFNDSCTGGTVSNTYSKSEIDLKLSLKPNESDVFNKTEINSMLSLKANKNELPDISNLATKDELKLKANKADVYSKIEIDDKFDDIDFSNYYTKNEVNIKIDDVIAGTIDLSQYYKKTETDNKLSSKVDKVAGKQLSSNDFSNAEKAKLQSLSNYDDTEIKQSIALKANKNELPNIAALATKDELKLKADAKNVYSKVEVDAKIDDVIAGGEVDLSSYYKKNEVDSKLSLKADSKDVYTKSQTYSKTEINNIIDNIETGTGGTVDLTNYYKKNEVNNMLATKADNSTISTLATKTELSLKANSSDVYTKREVDELIDSIETGTGGTTPVDTYSKSEIDLKLSLKADSANTYSRSELYTRRQIDSKLSDKTDVSRTTTLELELNKKANSSDVYTKAEVDNLIDNIESGGTGGTGTTSSEVYILKHDETQATEEHAALYTTLYNSFWYNKTITVLFNVLNGSDEFIVNVNNVYKDNAISRNEIKLSGSYITSSSIFCVEIVLKKDGSFTFTKNNIAINKLNTMQLEERVETLESEITNPTSMTVDCLNYE